MAGSLSFWLLLCAHVLWPYRFPSAPKLRLMPGRKPLELFFQVGLEWGEQTAVAVSGQLEQL